MISNSLPGEAKNRTEMCAQPDLDDVIRPLGHLDNLLVVDFLFLFLLLLLFFYSSPLGMGIGTANNSVKTVTTRHSKLEYVP